MSSQFLTFIFIILVSVQLSSCGWRFPWKNDEKNEMSTEKSFKDDEPKPSTAAIIYEGFDGPLPKILYPFSDNNLDESISGSSVQPTITTSKNVPNEEFDKYPEEESPNPHNSGKETKSLPTLNTSSTDSIFNYVSSTTTQITDSSTPITEKYESESSTTANTTTTATTENTLNDNDVNNVPRNADEDKDDSEGSSSVSVSSSTIPSSVENSSFENEVVSSFSEFISPKVTYAPNDNDISSSIDEEKEPTSDDQQIGRKDKETHSSRNVTDEPDHTTQKISTENYESGNSSTPMTNTPTTTENMLNSTSVNEPRNVIGDTENSGNSSKSETVSDLDPSASNQANTTIETILSTSTNTMNTTEMAGSMSNGTTPEVNFGSFVNSGSTGNTYSQLILNLCILIFSISVIV